MRIEDLNLKKPLGIGRLAAVYTWENDLVIKLFHKKVDTNVAEYEFSIMEELNDTNISTPKAYELIEEKGRVGIIMDKVRGETLVQALPKKWYKLKSMAFQTAETHYSIHQHKSETLPEYGKSLRDEIKSIQELEETTKNKLIEYIENLHLDNVICHGDFHPDNIMIEDDKLEVIDWITAKRGHPLMDVARTSMILQYSSPPSGLIQRLLINFFRKRFHKYYLQHYLEISGYSIDDLEQYYLPIMVARLVEGIEDEKEILLEGIRMRMGKLKN